MEQKNLSNNLNVLNIQGIFEKIKKLSKLNKNKNSWIQFYDSWKMMPYKIKWYYYFMKEEEWVITFKFWTDSSILLLTHSLLLTNKNNNIIIEINMLRWSWTAKYEFINSQLSCIHDSNVSHVECSEILWLIKEHWNVFQLYIEEEYSKIQDQNKQPILHLLE